MTRDDTLKLMQLHADAWNAHDADGLLRIMTEDCIYDASAGTTPYGARSQGHPALRPAFEAIWTTFPDARWDDARHMLDGDIGVTTWVFRGTRTDGTRVEVQGLDVLRFRGDKISHKDTYRKNLLG
jgi:ketosteroid isomerase-like protein